MKTLLKAAPVTQKIEELLNSKIKIIKSSLGRAPCLATVLVGTDPASNVYVTKKGETCKKLGLEHKDFKLLESCSQNELEDLIKTLNEDSSVDGILVQSPLPKNLDQKKIFDLINPRKDVDCFGPHNVGLLTQGRATLLPCTPAGIIELLKFYQINLSTKAVLVVGRSDIVGKPAALLALQENATITIAHSKTKNLTTLVEQADIVIAAIGKAKFLDHTYKWNKDAVVIDVGINRLPNNKLVGDVDFDYVSTQVAAITPVPGGVGPMTISMLMKNTVTAAEMRILNG